MTERLFEYRLGEIPRREWPKADLTKEQIAHVHMGRLRSHVRFIVGRKTMPSRRTWPADLDFSDVPGRSAASRFVKEV